MSSPRREATLGEVSRTKCGTEEATRARGSPDSQRAGHHHVSWFSPGTGVRISQIELAMPRDNVIAM